MDVQTAFEQRSTVLFLDVRERYEWDAGHVADSIHIPLMELPQRVAEVPDTRKVIVVCQVGQRSELAAKFLRDQGYEAHNLEGGLARWQAAGLPFESAGGKGEVVDGYARDFDGLINP
ncbi:MAG TPA: rhodanese-like domain-containing protein [Actinomycetota bacterium]|nr:rhodanese-like domain-containing protein [Actinomycetota bacterium]